MSEIGEIIEDLKKSNTILEKVLLKIGKKKVSQTINLAKDGRNKIKSKRKNKKKSIKKKEVKKRNNQ